MVGGKRVYSDEEEEEEIYFLSKQHTNTICNRAYLILEQRVMIQILLNIVMADSEMPLYLHLLYHLHLITMKYIISKALTESRRVTLIMPITVHNMKLFPLICRLT